MKVMSTPYETGGRSAQKARTRDALVAAARDLVAAGVTPTVEDAAPPPSISPRTRCRSSSHPRPTSLLAPGVTPTVEDAAASASISRSTAYRYFPNERALLLAAHPEIAATTMLPAHAPHDPAARLDAAVAHFTAMILDH